MLKIRIAILLILTMAISAFAQNPPGELRGVWLTSVASSIFNSKQSIAVAMDSLKRTGINAVFPSMLDNGYTLYPSPVMESITGFKVDASYSNRNLLEEIITEAHRVGIEVHPWMEYGFAAAFGKRGPILDSYPDWAGRRLSTGNAEDDDNFYWLSQANPEVQQFLISLALEIVDNYDVDGIMFDRIRYGNVKSKTTGELITTDFGYDDAHIEQYRAEHNGQNPPSQAWDGPWMKWRSMILFEFVRAVYDSVTTHNPNIMVTNTPVVYPYGYTLFLQNWPEWVKNNCVDFIAPQVYRYDLNSYANELGKIISQQIPSGYNRFYPGMLIREGSYNASPELAVNFITENRKRNLEGGIFWFYEGIHQIASALKQQVFQQPVQLPFHPDGWRPEATIVQENDNLVTQAGNWLPVTGGGAASYYSFDGKILTAMGSSGAKLLYQANVQIPAVYDVYFYHLYGSQLANNVPLKLLFENGKTILIDETNNLTKGWNKVGTARFDIGIHDILEISSSGVSVSKTVAADGMMLILNRRLTGTSTAIKPDREKNLTGKIELLNNYPNPFNSATIFTFVLPERETILLEVLDILGRPVITLARGTHTAGQHRFVFDASRLASGIYFCRLSTDSFSEVHKMMLVR